MTKEEMVKLLVDNDIVLTDNLGEAIYLFNNGVMVSGEFCDGIRGTDHATLLDVLPNSDNYKSLHNSYAVARLVPESMIALVSGLSLDNKLIDLLTEYGYSIEEY